MNGSSDLFDSLLQQKINCFALLLSPLILLCSFFFPSDLQQMESQSSENNQHM